MAVCVGGGGAGVTESTMAALRLVQLAIFLKKLSSLNGRGLGYFWNVGLAETAKGQSRGFLSFRL